MHTAGLPDLLRAMHACPRPIIGKVQGYCLAGGVGVALACDLLIAGESASFGTPEIRQGLFPMVIFAEIVRNLGLKHAMELVLLNPRVDARRALDIGLINAVYSTATFDEEVRRMAGTIAQGPPAAFAVAKGLMNQAAGMDRLDVHLDRELESLTRIADGTEFLEGLESFFAKRAPQFRQG